MKYKNIFIISLSLIYSTNIFANGKETNNGLTHPPTAQYHPLKAQQIFIDNPIFDKIVSDSYVQIGKYDENTYQIKLDKRIAKDLAKYFKEKDIQDVPEYINNNIVNSDRHIEIKADDTSFKSEAIDYFTSLSIKKGDKNLSLNRDEIIDVMKKNKRIIISATEKHGIDLQKINNKEDLYAHIDKFNVKNSSLFILDENITTKIDLAVKALEQDDYLINNTIQDHKQRTKENIEEHQKKINDNVSKIEKNEKETIVNANNIDKNKIDIQEANKNIENNINNIITNSHAIKKNEKNIIINTSNIEKNKTSIQEANKNIENNKNSIIDNKSTIDDIKENYIDNLNVNGNNISLKSHFATLYTEQSLSRNEFKTLKNNFEHFKSDTQNRFYKVEKRANQGIASVAAMSNLPFTDTATFSTAIGIGNYRNATALAWGMQYRINENVKVRASTAWNESNSWVSAGGVGVSW